MAAYSGAFQTWSSLRAALSCTCATAVTTRGAVSARLSSRPRRGRSLAFAARFGTSRAWLLTLCATFLCATAVPGRARAARVRSVSIQAPPCLDRAAAAAQILRLLGTADVGCEELMAWLHPAGERKLALLMVCGERSYRRELADAVDPTGTCGELPQTLALVADAWLRAPWRRFATGLDPPPGAAPPRQDPVADDPRLPIAPVDSGYQPPSSNRFPPPSRLRLLSQAGAALSPAEGGGLVPELAAGVEWDASRRWGLALLASYTGPATASRLPGRVSASFATLALLGRATPWQWPSGSLGLLGGPGLAAVHARSVGFTGNDRFHQVDGALALAVRLRQSFSRAVGGVLSAGLVLRTHRHTFHIDNVGPVLAARWFGLSLGAGLYWNAF